jgi:hypothetical protein
MKKLALLVGLLLSTAAFAQHGGGGHAGGGGGAGHGGGGGHSFGGYGGGAHGGGYAGWHGGYGGYGGWRGEYGGYRGWYGGYRGWYGGWGWGGLGFGLFAASLPLYYSTYWWDGVPYYYASNNYYLWNPSMGGYVTVDPPPQVREQAPQTGTPAAADLFAYPKSGQTTAQQSTDRFECHEWAVKQTGFDPSASVATDGRGVTGSSSARRSDYLRAQAACLQGRGYSVQ